MKYAFALAALLMSQICHASLTESYRCSDSSDPDYIDLSLYAEGGKTIAFIGQASGDGDSYDQDVVVVEKANDGNDAMLTFIQVEDPGLRLQAIREFKFLEKPTGHTRGLRLQVPFMGGETVVKMSVAPNGDSSGQEAEIDCQPLHN